MTAITSLSSGRITDKQVFVIICAVAVLLAGITLGKFFWGGLHLKPAPNWECLECGYKFSKNEQKLPLPPIECPQCHKVQAVMLGYRICPDCHNRVLYSRVRLTKEYAEHLQLLREQGSEPSPEGTVDWLREAQFRLLDTADQWTDWVLWRSPEAVQIQEGMKCPKCGRALYPKRERVPASGS